MNNTGKLVQVSMLSVIVMMGFMASMHSVAALNMNNVLSGLSGAVSASADDNLSEESRVSVGDTASDSGGRRDGPSNGNASSGDSPPADGQGSLEATAASDTGGDSNGEENSSDNRTYTSGRSGISNYQTMNATDYGNVTNMTNVTYADYSNSTEDDNESSEAGLGMEDNERAQTSLLAEINARLSDIRSLLASIVARIGANNDSNASIEANSTNVTNMTGNVSMPVVEVNESTNASNGNRSANGTADDAGNIGNVSSNGTASDSGDDVGSGNANGSLMQAPVVGIEISRGVGWSMNADEQASFTRFASSKQAFIDPDGKTGYESGLAILQIEGEEYGLVMDESESNGTAQVYRMAANDSGMLLLQQRLTAGSFATWQGTFTDSDGDSYNVGLVTMKRSMELSPSAEVGSTSASSGNLSIQENSTAEFQEEFDRIASAEMMNTT